jgi:cytochrome P450
VGGEGLFASEGAHWLRQRRLMQPAFHRQRIAGFAEVMTGQTLRLLESWEQPAKSGKLLDISQEFTNLIMRIIAQAMFSSQVEGDLQAVSQAITLLLEDINFRFQTPFYPNLGFPTPRNFRARAALRVVDKVVYQIIAQRRQRQQPVNDLLGMLMEARDPDTGAAMSDKHLRDEVITIFIAGHETTAVLLTWLFHILSQEPEWDQRLADEVSQALHGRLPAFTDLAELLNLRMAIDETLRLYPPAWMTSRSTLQDDEVCGYRIQAGEVAAFSAYAIHRLPEFWPDPERFDPQRFSPENSASRPRFAYIPFGGGPHQCIGNNFALAEAQLIFATLAQRYRLQAAPEHPVQLEPTITLRPKGGVWMRLQERR